MTSSGNTAPPKSTGDLDSAFDEDALLRMSDEGAPSFPSLKGQRMKERSPAPPHHEREDLD